MTKHYMVFTEFNAGLEGETNPSLFKKVNSLAVRAGYLVAPEACTEEMCKTLEGVSFNPNTTFYKTWEDVLRRSNEELLFDQITHYFTTYGTNFTAKPYVPNGEPDVIPYKDYKLIPSITVKEVSEKIVKILASGIALKAETVDNYIDFLTSSAETAPFIKKIVTEEIGCFKNKMAQARLCDKFNIAPKDPITCLRLFSYILIKEAEILQNKEYLERIKYSSSRRYSQLEIAGALEKDIISNILYKRMAEISTVFFRYKKMILCLKTPNNTTVINKIRKLAVKNHVPFHAGFWETMLAKQTVDIPVLNKFLPYLNTFKIVKLIQTIDVRLGKQKSETELHSTVFTIRNGKSYVRQGYVGKLPTNAAEVRQILLDELKNRIRKNLLKEDGTMKTVKLHEHIDFAIPTSAKNFIGNYPSGSCLTVPEENLIVGIYWREEWGTRDYDLHLISKKGEHYGWNGFYTPQSSNITYSGDMTSAFPEASEAFHIKKFQEGCSITVSRYSGVYDYDDDGISSRLNKEDIKFRLFIGTDTGVDKVTMDKYGHRKSYIIDPNKIITTADIPLADTTTKLIGRLKDGKFFFQEGQVRGRVVEPTLQSIMDNADSNKLESYLHWKPIMEELGVTFVSDNADIDLSSPNKETFISLMTEQGED